MIDSMEREFTDIVWRHYDEQGRHDLPWRTPEADGSFDPYKIMVSEVMLQQTQVGRVIPKYHEFLGRFPTTGSLAAAQLGEVLRIWNGLGYNRRAKFLHEAARQIMHSGDGRFPRTVEGLVGLPGIGQGTAGAIVSYAFGQPVAFLETNIRTVFIHHFFQGGTDVSDKEIFLYVEQTLDTARPREWYWALMDYGAYLKRSVGNLNRQAKSYGRQSRFEGSRRQIRGRVIHLLGKQSQTLDELEFKLADERLEGVLAELVTERLIVQRDDSYHL